MGSPNHLSTETPNRSMSHLPIQRERLRAGGRSCGQNKGLSP